MGEANQRTLELVRNWCAHLSVDKIGGGGLIEQFSDLPIGPRSLSCPHAVATGFTGHDLRFLAVDFYDRNCAGCTHRKPVGFPNLSALIGERDARRSAADEETRHREAADAQALQRRDEARQLIRAQLAPASADVIDQIEGIDHRREDANADRLAETARLAPDVFTAPIVDYAFGLLEAGQSWFDTAGLRVLKALTADPSRLMRCALMCLPRLVARDIAADILVENLGLADETLVGAAVPALISMARPQRLLLGGTERRPYAVPLLRTYGAFPKAVAGAIETLFDGSPYDIGLAARGIAVLAEVDSKLPGRFARSLISKLTRDRRLLEASEHYGNGDGETIAELREVLGVAFATEPVEIDKLLKAFLAGASETAEARILSVYRAALHEPRFADEDVEITEASRLALNRIVWHTTETTSYTVLHEIAGFLSGRPWRLIKLAASEVRQLLGAAIVIEGQLQALSGAPAIEDPVGRVAMNQIQRRDEMKTLRESLIRWAAAGAGESPDGTEAYIEVLAGLPSEGDDEIKVDMVRNLDEVMKKTAGLTAALPQLYTALVGGSLALRAAAVNAVGELDRRQQDNLPDLVFEAFMALLLDPYRWVHKHAARALERTSLPEQYRSRAKASLFLLILGYARDRQDDHFLIDCLDFYVDRYAEPDEFHGKRGSWLISVLEKIEPWVVAKEIGTFGRALAEHDQYVPLLVHLLADADAWDMEHEHLTRALAQLPARVVGQHLEELEAVASEAQAENRRMGGVFIELFTRVGAWEAAARLAETGAAAIPDDAWNRTRKFTADQIRIATAFEAALASGLYDRVRALADDWKAVAAALDKDWAEYGERRDPIRGLRGQN